MKKGNPFTLTFGRTPAQFISRIAQTQEIVDDLGSESPLSPVYMITGVRGSGKTVMLAEISKIMAEQYDWIVIALNPERDLIGSFAAKLYETGGVKKLFTEKTMGLSLYVMNASVSSERPLADPEALLETMLKELKEQGKKVLITIDEASNNQHIREFTQSFQILLRQDLPVYLIMTGLFQNIDSIQNSKTLTFLYRAPKIYLEPLNLNAICESYERVIGVSHEFALRMACLSGGYSFAYQVLGALVWEQDEKNLEYELLMRFDNYLEEYVYDKIWSEISEKDRELLIAIREAKSDRAADIMQACGMDAGTYSVYRKRLLKSGLAVAPNRGVLGLMLPRFGEYIDRRLEFEKAMTE